jgi:7,8-dihydropterin-6-yl-methyl-4-(beta-D-ribofuranosyl)aminobenzene 5'-phosphate synthase
VWLAIALAPLAFGLWRFAVMDAQVPTGQPPQRVTVVYNNVPHAPGLATAWGFAAVIAMGNDRVLFDTGGDGAMLLDNLRKLRIDLDSVDAVVLSHIHGDHVGGLNGVLERRPDVVVYLPQSFPAGFRRSVEQRGAQVESVSGPKHLFGAFHSTGELDSGTREQALIIDTEAGLVIITGCAHPGIVEVARSARAYLGKDIYLLMGGFHLSGLDQGAIRGIIAELRRLGVRKVAPSHCTGHEATELFRASWGSDFLEGGCGAVIELPQPAARASERT